MPPAAGPTARSSRPMREPVSRIRTAKAVPKSGHVFGSRRAGAPLVPGDQRREGASKQPESGLRRRGRPGRRGAEFSSSRRRTRTKSHRPILIRIRPRTSVRWDDGSRRRRVSGPLPGRRVHEGGFGPSAPDSSDTERRHHRSRRDRGGSSSNAPWRARDAPPLARSPRVRSRQLPDPADRRSLCPTSALAVAGTSHGTPPRAPVLAALRPQAQYPGQEEASPEPIGPVLLSRSVRRSLLVGQLARGVNAGNP